MRERYDKSNPSPDYHAMWSHRFAKRADVAFKVSIFFFGFTAGGLFCAVIG